MSAESNDIWGEIFTDYQRGLRIPHQIVRDDGQTQAEHADRYFDAPRGAEEEALLARIEGRVLDAACGPGAYTLALQKRGLEVIAVDSSRGAIAVCTERGCADARVMDVRELRFEPATFDAVLLMGGSFGLGPDRAGQIELLRRLHEITTSDGIVVGSTLNPIATGGSKAAPGADLHAAYHERNRRVGKPPGLIRIRIAYRGRQGPWFEVWMMTPDEIEATATSAGWRVRSLDPSQPACLCVLKKATS